ncbi:MAG: RebB family R body protein [Polyangiaceae bacterium]|nr:RebB family R body protein [Polyangiaceae bacterium]
MAGEGLPQEILDAISISNAKSIGEQPAILANLALANQIANINLAQQQAVTAQQAMLQVTIATMSKCVEAILTIDPAKPGAATQMQQIQSIVDRCMQVGASMAAGPQRPKGQEEPPAPPGAAPAR